MHMGGNSKNTLSITILSGFDDFTHSLNEELSFKFESNFPDSFVNRVFHFNVKSIISYNFYSSLALKCVLPYASNVEMMDGENICPQNYLINPQIAVQQQKKD